MCHNLPAAPGAAWGVAAFFAAMTPVALAVDEQAVAAAQAAADGVAAAQRQQLERLRYEAMLAERQGLRGDPDNRLVAAELEQRGEEALRARKAAEERGHQQPAGAAALVPLPAALREAFSNSGTPLPRVGDSGVLTPVHKKALLRCRIETGGIHRTARDQRRVRLVWHGGATTTRARVTTVGALADLSDGAELERLVVAWTQTGREDAARAQARTRRGLRAPQRPQVLASTVRGMRRRQRLLRTRSPAPPRHGAGSRTVPQGAAALGVTSPWIYDRLHNGTIAGTRDPTTKRYRFPDPPATLEALTASKEGRPAPRCPGTGQQAASSKHCRLSASRT